MWRTLQLFGSALLAAWAIQLALGQPGPAPIYLRDGLIIAVLAVLLFAWRAGPPRSIRPTGVAYHWPSIGRAIWGAGLATSIAALLAFALDNEGAFVSALSITLWLIGPLLMLIGAFWRGPVRDFPTPTSVTHCSA